MSTTELHTLQRARGHLKARVTKFKTYLQTVLTDDQAQAQLSERLTRVKETWAQFHEIQEKIENLDESDSFLAEQESERMAFEEAYYDAVATAKVKLAVSQAAQAPINTNALIQTNTSAPSFSSASINLPAIQLPSFDGNYTQWQHFYDSFLALVDKNDKLSNVQKLVYLNSTLSGKARQAIEALPLINTNYGVALETLKNRFDNPRLAVRQHVTALFEIMPIQREAAGALRGVSDCFNQNLQALRALGEPVKHWDTLLTYILSSKLDPTTKREWESKVVTNNCATITKMLEFLTTKCETLEATPLSNVTSVNTKPQTHRIANRRAERTGTYVATNKSIHECPLCHDEHKIYGCNVLRRLSIPQRFNEIKRLNLCINCLGANHTFKECSARACKHCDKRHHSLLHTDDKSNSSKTASNRNSVGSPKQSEQQPSSHSDENIQSQAKTPVINTFNACSVERPSQILLSTAVIRVFDKAGNAHEARVLLDSGSQSNFMSSELCDRLQLTKHQSNHSVSGLGQTVTNVYKSTYATIQSRINAFNVKLPFLVVDGVTQRLPATRIDNTTLNIPSNVTLADPLYHVPQKIDVLLGSGIFWNLLCAQQIQLGRNLPIIQKTNFGWILAGPYTAKHRSKVTEATICGHSMDVSLQQHLERFWQIEECQNTTVFSEEERACENHFQATHRRDQDGRFVVALPLKGDPTHLGESRQFALKRLQGMERRFEKYPHLKVLYQDFMTEYESLNHMSEVSNETLQPTTQYFLPHHAVTREESITSKLRVVFDASSRTTSGLSLNDILMVGPTIQEDLFSIMCRFRQHTYVLTADIRKMYRQILLEPNQRFLQRILWRNDKTDTTKTFELNTVTYGLATAPFLAIRCLEQLAITYKDQFPEACGIIRKDFYVDDLITGYDDITRLARLKHEITTILSSAHFEMHKWNSNVSELANPSGTSTTDSYHIGEETTTLGLRWQPTNDYLKYKVTVPDNPGRSTKRSILSIISQIFDPLGLVGPAIIKAKILLQRLWQLKFGWDEALPMDIHTTWSTYKKQLLCIRDITIPRHVLCRNPRRIEMHGFCDASESAYGVCVYLKSIDSNEVANIQLLCGKSRVAPLKAVCLPRLELLGALLLARLCKKLQQSLTVNIDATYYWCDSTITLAWIRGEPSRWKTFVRNRVSEIQSITHQEEWSHVCSQDNPADIISRGLNPDQLAQSGLWWKGPDWLLNNSEFWPIKEPTEHTEILEAKQQPVILISTSEEFVLTKKFSSLSRLKRVTAYCLRYVNNIFKKSTRASGEPSVEELDAAMLRLIKLAQAEDFSEELRDLQQKKEIHPRSRLITLCPFLDNEGIIRVGGRLVNAPLPYARRFPVVLGSKNHLTELIIRDAHYKQLHAGPLALLATIRQEYWILSARNSIRRVLHRCIVCFRNKPRSPEQLMGSLPSDRLTPSRAFHISGVDYAGPFTIRTSRNKTSKAYLCLFVCMNTKAVHLELASDLTTSCFLNAFKRFISRRGKCHSLYSDNGRNFIGANNELKEMGNLLSSPEHQRQTINCATEHSVRWHFIPPHSPHVGGLWEAAVRSAKAHLKAVIGTTSLTFEELYTLLTQVEACLNSRPLSPLSPDPNDLQPLTPGHFLIGTALTALPEQDLMEVSSNRLTRYNLLVNLHQHFWHRWSREYISQLQQRFKWNKLQPNVHLKQDTLVLIRDENVPPLQWRLGRVIELHPGKDGLVRTVSLRTQQGVVTRTLPKICILPLED